MFSQTTPAFTRPKQRSPLPSATLNRINPLECTVTKNVSATSSESALSRSLDLKSFRMRTYEKRWGGTPRCFSGSLLPCLLASLLPAPIASPSGLFKFSQRGPRCPANPRRPSPGKSVAASTSPPTAAAPSLGPLPCRAEACPSRRNLPWAASHGIAQQEIPSRESPAPGNDCANLESRRAPSANRGS